MPRSKFANKTGNNLLDGLPASELDRLLEGAKILSCSVRDEVGGLRWPNQHVYFPTSGVYSLLLEMTDGMPVEVAVVDSEGMLGIPIVLGMNENPLRAVAQVAGQCIRVPQDRFLAVLSQTGTLEQLVRRFLAVSWQTANQTIACTLRHTVKQRTCRWLLSVHDRTQSDEFDVTHEILSGMVGASRQKITSVVGELKKSGIIGHRRGRPPRTRSRRVGEYELRMLPRFTKGLSVTHVVKFVSRTRKRRIKRPSFARPAIAGQESNETG